MREGDGCWIARAPRLASWQAGLYGGQWTVIDNDKCEDSVPQCGIIAHWWFIDQKWSENKNRWDRIELN